MLLQIPHRVANLFASSNMILLHLLCMLNMCSSHEFYIQTLNCEKRHLDIFLWSWIGICIIIYVRSVIQSLHDLLCMLDICSSHAFYIGTLNCEKGHSDLFLWSWIRYLYHYLCRVLGSKAFMQLTIITNSFTPLFHLQTTFKVHKTSLFLWWLFLCLVGIFFSYSRLRFTIFA